MTRYLLAISMLALVTACSGPAENSETKRAAPAVSAPVPANSPLQADTRLAAVLVYADWCSSCKILDPKLQASKAEGPINGLQHLVLDYTDRDDEAFFASADAIGIGGAIRDQLKGSVTTGILLLVDIDDRKVVADLRKELSPAELRAAMLAAADAA